MADAHFEGDVFEAFLAAGVVGLDTQGMRAIVERRGIQLEAYRGAMADDGLLAAIEKDIGACLIVHGLSSPSSFRMRRLICRSCCSPGLRKHLMQ